MFLYVVVTSSFFLDYISISLAIAEGNGTIIDLCIYLVIYLVIYTLFSFIHFTLNTCAGIKFYTVS